MTLILTEISQVGIAMVADSAKTITPDDSSGRLLPSVTYDAKKLHAIPYLNAAISIWGRGSIEPLSVPVPIDDWLADFINSQRNLVSIHSFAELLRDELNSLANARNEISGFHLAGYMEEDRYLLPTLYHIRNVEYEGGQYIRYSNYILGHDFPPGPVSKPIRWRNGDHQIYAMIADTVEGIAFPLITERLKKMKVPSPTLEGRIAYLVSWVRFISGLYGSSLKDPSIGGDISAIGIRPNGRLTNLRRYNQYIVGED